jgi:hypothetical protein
MLNLHQVKKMYLRFSMTKTIVTDNFKKKENSR